MSRCALCGEEAAVRSEYEIKYRKYIDIPDDWRKAFELVKPRITTLSEEPNWRVRAIKAEEEAAYLRQRLTEARVAKPIYLAEQPKPELPKPELPKPLPIVDAIERVPRNNVVQ
jgi:hypothetical protein